MKRSSALLIGCLALASACAQSPKLSSAQNRRFSRELARLEKTFFDDQRKDDQFGEHFWRESKRIADACGPEIIHAIMVRGRMWKGEEGLIFMPLVALLPRPATLKLLKQYEQSNRESDRIWAREYQIEFEASDTQEMVRKFGARK